MLQLLKLPTPKVCPQTGHNQQWLYLRKTKATKSWDRIDGTDLGLRLWFYGQLVYLPIWEVGYGVIISECV